MRIIKNWELILTLPRRITDLDSYPTICDNNPIRTKNGPETLLRRRHALPTLLDATESKFSIQPTDHLVIQPRTGKFSEHGLHTSSRHFVFWWWVFIEVRDICYGSQTKIEPMIGVSKSFNKRCFLFVLHQTSYITLNFIVLLVSV
jgi:hypothetical protein